MPIRIIARIPLGDLLALYQTHEGVEGPPGLVLIPAATADQLVAPREHLDAPAVRTLPREFQPVRAYEVDPLVHVKVRGSAEPAMFSQGRSLRAGPATVALAFHSQQVIRSGYDTLVRTVLRSADGLECVHDLRHTAGQGAVRIRTTVRNTGLAQLTLDLVTSFSLGGLTPYAPDDAPDRLRVHRFRSAWSAEGRHEEISFEALHLERSWLGHPMLGERFGQVGSLPVRGWFPFLGVEDRVAGVHWAAQLAHPGSWQMEIYRRGDRAAISGGLADREFGHWWKTLAPGETLVAPEALLTATTGGLDDACDRLLGLHRAALDLPAPERLGLPIIFNEWCTHWGTPTHDKVLALADRLQGSGVKYFVIDDGWAQKELSGPGQIQLNGDWRVDPVAFPHGLRATCDALRQRGFVPGLWFEHEVVKVGTRPWREDHAHFLRRDGHVLQIGTKCFWDFRDPWVLAFLEDRVIKLIRECNLGYLKIDYNETLGIGADGAESPGEALRQHLAAVQDFLRRLRGEFPDLVIENCASGGHRLEPSFLALSSMSSFSDAHETPDIPLIAANLHRLVLPRQSQIWAVLHRSDSLQRLAYSLASGFLGRLCLSGEVHDLDAAQWQLVREFLDLYGRVAPVIEAGRWRRHGLIGDSWQHPEGAQAVLAVEGARALLVWHAFAAPPAEVRVPLPLQGNWRIVGEHGAPGLLTAARIIPPALIFAPPAAFTGGVIELQARFP